MIPQTTKLFAPDHMTILDGAMGTQLQLHGLPVGELPESWSLTHPQVVEQIHRAYIRNGAHYICTNTFGANAHKLQHGGYGVREIITASVEIAKKAALGTSTQVLLDIGPLGTLLAPNGTLSFADAYALYAEMVQAGAQAGADAILLETMMDLYELKAAVLAAKEHTSLPVLTSMTFEKTGRTFLGCPVEAFAAVMTGLGVDALGINCSLGPKEIYPLAQTLCQSTALPVFVKPNAGLPDPVTGEYLLSAADFAAQLQPYIGLGITAVGGCCGTSPEYIAALTQAFAQTCPQPRTVPAQSVVCSANTLTHIDHVAVIGERINPTGKKRLQQALREEDLAYLSEQALDQMEAGAQILDVNVGLPELDERSMMVRAIQEIQSVCNLPLQLDSTRPDVLEAGLRIYNGKPIVNSVSGERASLDAILPLCKKYGAAVVGLTLDEQGIPQTAEQRFAIAQRIVDAAGKHGIPKEDIFIDCLTVTASAQQQAVRQTLTAMRRVRQELGVKTVLGVSNISFGLPCREYINTTFLALALAHGLNLPIINPNNERMMAVIQSFGVLYGYDKDSTAYIARYADSSHIPAAAPTAPTASLSAMDALRDAVLHGREAAAVQAASTALQAQQAVDVIEQGLIPALDTVGNLFEQGKYFLPQLLQSANAAQAAFSVIKQALANSGTPQQSKGKIVLCTVKGDIHDIGKNIVKTVLENYGYQVIDLGRDVAPETVVEAVQRHAVRLVGLSALMTTTLPHMADTILALRKAALPCQVMVGGAVLTPEYAAQIHADFYAKDAMQSVEIARQVFD